MNKNYLLGLDIGGTKIECALIRLNDKDGDFHITTKKHGKLSAVFLTRQRISTMRHAGYDEVLANIGKLCLEVLEKNDMGLEDIAGIGMGLPGTIHPEKKIMLNGNSGIFIGKEITKDLCNFFGKKITIKCENDATLFALAEVLCGAGQKYLEETGKKTHDQTAIGLILGTGVGGGIILRENMLCGKNGGGGEVGHSVLHTGGHPCYCGNNGCVEQYLSGPSIEALYASRIYSQIKKNPDAREIFEMAKNHEPLAMAVIKQYRKNLVKFLTNLTNIFDPDYFVFGGGVSTQDEIYKGLEEKLAESSFVPGASPMVYKHVLGDSSGVVGAAILLLLDQE
ncbi:MAG: ROK family protein [Bacteriovoracaceae bacterium]|nr:ROK family protein [Bacteriovoracaceae bacterium]